MMRCLSCKYDLRNLSENRCPECGREFDPNDPTTFSVPDPAQQRGFSIGMTIVILICLLWPMLMHYYFGDFGLDSTLRRVVMFLGPLTALAVAIWAIVTNRKGQRPEG